MITNYLTILKSIAKTIKSSGLVAVFYNTCSGGKSFTYQIDGPVPVYLGSSDLHDPKVSEIPNFINWRTSLSTFF